MVYYGLLFPSCRMVLKCGDVHRIPIGYSVQNIVFTIKHLPLSSSAVGAFHELELLTLPHLNFFTVVLATIKNISGYVQTVGSARRVHTRLVAIFAHKDIALSLRHRSYTSESGTSLASSWNKIL